MNVCLIVFFLTVTVYFVMVEAAIRKVRPSQLLAFHNKENRRTLATKKLLAHTTAYASLCRLGSTAAVLGMGWLGGTRLASGLVPLLGQLQLSPSVISIISVCTVFASLTVLHAVASLLASRVLAIQSAERIVLYTAGMLWILYKILFPCIWLIHTSSAAVARLFGYNVYEQEKVHSEEELRLLMEQSYEKGEMKELKYQYVNQVFSFDTRTAKEVMVPRTEMVIIEEGQSFRQVIEIMSKEKYTRYPVISGNKDHIVGMINLKDVFTDFVTAKNESTMTIQPYLRPVIQVIESTSLHDLFLKMQSERIHMAILVDEYGGTAGLVTIEDLLEEIVGDIQDEFDLDEQPNIQKIDEHKTIVEGKVLVTEVNELLGLSINDRDVDTIGGWMLTEHFAIQEGESIQIDAYIFYVLQMEGHCIKQLEITKKQATSSFHKQEKAATIHLKEQMGS